MSHHYISHYALTPVRALPNTHCVTSNLQYCLATVVCVTQDHTFSKTNSDENWVLIIVSLLYPTLFLVFTEKQWKQRWCCCPCWASPTCSSLLIRGRTTSPKSCSSISTLSYSLFRWEEESLARVAEAHTHCVWSKLSESYTSYILLHCSFRVTV